MCLMLPVDIIEKQHILDSFFPAHREPGYEATR